METQLMETEKFCAVVGDMSKGISSVREVIHSLKEKSSDINVKDGISLLSLKHILMISYLQSLTLVSARRLLGHSLNVRSPPTQKFSALDRAARGNDCGDLIDSLVESRIVLEKIKILESRIRYQVEKLVRIAEEPDKIALVADDPLTFRPDPQNLSNYQNEDPEVNGSTVHNIEDRHDVLDHDGIYRPPRVAAMPYHEKSKSQIRKERPPVPSALASLSSDPTRPHVETTSGLGGIPTLASGRAAYLKRLNDFEEENFSRVMMKKSEAKRRARDEEDLALGGGLSSGVSGQRHRRAGGLEDEFSDVLKSVGRVSGGKIGGSKGDGYEELRTKSKKADILERSRQERGMNKRREADTNEVDSRTRKRSRFELETKTARKKLARGKPL